MRILGKICGFVAAALLVLQSSLLFTGYPLSGVGAGIEFVALAFWCATDALTSFKKPHPIFRKFVVRYDDGTVERHAGPANEKWGFSTAEGKRVVCIDVSDVEGVEDDDGKQD